MLAASIHSLEARATPGATCFNCRSTSRRVRLRRAAIGRRRRVKKCEIMRDNARAGVSSIMRENVCGCRAEKVYPGRGVRQPIRLAVTVTAECHKSVCQSPFTCVCFSYFLSNFQELFTLLHPYYMTSYVRSQTPTSMVLVTDTATVTD